TELIQQQFRFGIIQTLGVRPPPHRYHEPVALEPLRPAFVFVLDGHALFRDLRPEHARAQTDVETLGAKLLVGFASDLAVRDGEKAFLRPETLPHASKLEADDAGADDPQAGGNAVERERTRRIDYAIAR